MANRKYLNLLKQGVSAWNEWRENSSEELRPDLSEAELSGINLSKINFYRTDLSGADFRDAKLREANLREANLSEADLSQSDLSGADLYNANCWKANLRGAVINGANLNGANLNGANLNNSSLYWADLNKAKLREANLRGADLREADLREADLSGSDLREADLNGTRLIKTILRGANLSGCLIYGVSAWGVELEEAEQRNLIITEYGEPIVTVDNLEVAQFIYLLLNNRKIRDVINTITSKAVLILGRFTLERKAVLDAIREELRQRDYLPILFDFDKPSSHNLTETVSTLAHISRFVIADITDAKSIPQELQRIVPSLPSLPIQPLILSSQHEYAMFKDFLDYPWVLSLHRYDSPELLLESLGEKVITPAETKAKEIEERRKGFEEEISK